MGLIGTRFGGIGLAGFGIDWLGAGIMGLCGMGLAGRCSFFGIGILGDGKFGEGRFGDRFGEGMFGDGIDGDGREGDGSGMLEEGGFCISLGRLGGVGGTFRRFSKDSHTSFRIKSHSTWYDVYHDQETTLAHIGKKD